ncbi:MAG UNVERIFIED_CONTAM: hypothetical protein LVR18_36775 [Planctomycetaceae bacterium]
MEDLERRHGDAVTAVQSKLQNELWVLNEVLDENREDSLVSQAERARENFDTQDVSLKQRLEDLSTRMQASVDYLQACHAAPDDAQPAAAVQARNREAARTESLEWIDKVVITSGRLNRLTLPQWIIGARLYAAGAAAVSGCGDRQPGREGRYLALPQSRAWPAGLAVAGHFMPDWRRCFLSVQHDSAVDCSVAFAR